MQRVCKVHFRIVLKLKTRTLDISYFPRQGLSVHFFVCHTHWTSMFLCFCCAQQSTRSLRYHHQQETWQKCGGGFGSYERFCGPKSKSTRWAPHLFSFGRACKYSVLQVIAENLEVRRSRSRANVAWFNTLTERSFPRDTVACLR